jgi:GT2 family glycosyltransferase
MPGSMPEPKLSVIVPTHNRPARLEATLSGLAGQRDLDRGDFELIVVDDGSVPAAAPEAPSELPLSVLRLEDEGPSAARNRGAGEARGELLVFVDDDLRLVPDFLAAHWRAHLEWPGALQVGSVRLPEAATTTPFGRFRQRLEDESVPRIKGPVESRNFCTAANMAIERGLFDRLGGFDPSLGTGEDQDLALRHTAQGGKIVFVPEARVVHDDEALAIDSYCDRAERYMEELVRFSVRHPEWPDNVERERVNGPVRWGREPLGTSAKKLLKGSISWRPVRAALLAVISLVERVAPNSGLLDRLYRALLGAQLQRGYRRGLREAGG